MKAGLFFCAKREAGGRATGKRCSVFHMSMGVFEHIGRGVVVYAFLFFLLRFAGKKHVGQLAPFDLVVLLILSETVQNSLIGDDTSLVGGLISAATLVGLSYGMSVLTNYSKFAERLLEGTPKILVRHGRRRKDEMDRQRISLAELTEALRHQGCTNITQGSSSYIGKRWQDHRYYKLGKAILGEETSMSSKGARASRKKK